MGPRVRISGAYGDRLEAQVLREYALVAAEGANVTLAVGCTLRVYRAGYATTPGLWGSAQRSTTLLASFAQ